MSKSGLRFAISGYIGLLISYSPIILAPIFSYKFNNWWLLFSILFSWIGSAVASKKSKRIIALIVLIAAIIFWSYKGFDFHKIPTFYFLSFAYGFILYILYKIIGFGDIKSRAMIAGLGNPHAREEIEKEIDKGMAKWRAERKENSNTPNS